MTDLEALTATLESVAPDNYAPIPWCVYAEGDYHVVDVCIFRPGRDELEITSKHKRLETAIRQVARADREERLNGDPLRARTGG